MKVEGVQQLSRGRVHSLSKSPKAAIPGSFEEQLGGRVSGGEGGGKWKEVREER